MSDHELLQRYVRERSERTFAALVERHLPLVYSAARRQVRSSHLAEDVAQTVFLDLFRQADALPRDQSLVAWLHVVTRRTAIDLVRAESRRQARELTAALDAMPTAPSVWSEIEPLLDEAVATLGEPDRTAILLRFFQNKSLRDVGAALGTSDDAAQKRVTRALDQLRSFFHRRGVALTAAGLATDLSAFTIETTPAALAAHIASTAPLLSAVSAPAAATVVQQVALTIVQKSLGAAVAAALLGLALYETATFVRQRDDLAAAQSRTDEHRATLRQLRVDETSAGARLQQARAALAANSRLAGPDDPAVDAAIEAWLQRLGRLKQLAAGRPEFAIDELAVLTEDQWFSAAREAQFDSEEQTRATFRKVHEIARNAMAQALARALTRFADAHDGQLPFEAVQLAPFLPPHLPATLFDRYEVLQRGALVAMPAYAWLLAERPELALGHASRVFVTRGEAGVDDLTTVTDREFGFAVRAFAAAHADELPTAPAQLLPHLRTPPTPAARESLLAKLPADFSPVVLRPLLAK